MAAFGSLILTDVGNNFSAQAFASSGSITITRVEAGSGSPSGSTYIPGLANLVNPIMPAQITGISNLVPGQLTVRANISSANSPSTFSLNEWGIFGKFAGSAEFLLAYATTGGGGDTVTPTGSGTPVVKDVAFLMKWQQAISSSGNIQLVQAVGLHSLSHISTGTDPIPYPSTTHSGLLLATLGTGSNQLIDTNPPTWSPTLLVISANSTLFVTTSGSDATGVIGNASFPFATVQGALNKLQNYVILPGVTVLISVAAGTYTSSAPITVNNPSATQINIVGADPISTTVTAMGTVTGSAGSWSIPLTLASAAGINVGDYLMVSATAGAQDYLWFSGIWKVASVAGNVVTVTGTQQRLRFAGSTITGGTVRVCKTQLSFTGCDGFDVINCSLGLLDKVTISGNSTSGTRGMYIPAGTQVTSGLVGVSGFDYGVYLTGSGGNLNGNTVYACGHGVAGVSANYGAATNLTFSICSGNVSYGAYAQAGSVISFGANSTFSNNGTAGVYISVATAFVNSCNVTGNNINGIECLNGGRIASDICNSCVNVSADYFAFNASFISASTHQLYAGSGAAFNPAQNTVGGNNSIITGS